jgi:hypothetical protein
MRWVGHVIRNAEVRNAYTVSVKKKKKKKKGSDYFGDLGEQYENRFLQKSIVKGATASTPENPSTSKCTGPIQSVVK